MRGLIWLLLATVVSAAGVFWLFFAGDPEPKPTPQAAAPPAESAPAAEPAVPETERQAPAQDAAPPVIVDSFPESGQPRIEDWARVADIGGHFDVLLLQNSGTALADGNVIRSDQLIVAKGWAGDHGLGIRYSDVLLSMCGVFVARAQVSGSRPDVAKVVHPNLTISGWSAEIYAGDLPSCENPELQGWAVVPGPRAALAALVGKRRINVQPVDNKLEHVSSQVPVNQLKYWPYKAVQIRVTASRANMRRCGSTDCAVVTQVDGGTYPGIVLDRTDGWSLVVVGDRAGWLFDDLFETIS